MTMTNIRAKRNLSGNIALVIFLAFLVTLTIGVCPNSAAAASNVVNVNTDNGNVAHPITVTTDSLKSLQLTVQISPLTPSEFSSVLLKLLDGKGNLVSSVYLSQIYASNGATVYGSGYQFVYSWNGLNLNYGTNSGYTLVEVYGSTTKTVYLTVEGPPRPSSGGGGGGGGTVVPKNTVTEPAGTLASMFADNQSYTVTIDGVTLVLPPGSLDLTSFAAQGANLVFSVTEATEGSTVPAGSVAYKIAGKVYHISIRVVKDGVDIGGITTFSKPITLTLPYTGTEDAGIFRLNESTNAWEPMGGTVDPATGTISVPRTSLSTYAVGVYTTVFSDTAGHWAKGYINQLIAMGAVTGYADGTFKPDQSITRAEFVSILVKAFKLQGTAGKVFDDTVNHWAKDYIAAAAANGIVNGYNDQSFGPDDLITREQMAVMIANAAKLGTTTGGITFTDSAQISDWAKAAVSAASARNIIEGCPDHSFKPQANATRAEAATVIVKGLLK